MKGIKVPRGKVLSAMNHPSRSRQDPKVYEVTLNNEREEAWSPTSAVLVKGPAFLTYTQTGDGLSLSVVRLDSVTEASPL